VSSASSSLPRSFSSRCAFPAALGQAAAEGAGPAVEELVARVAQVAGAAQAAQVAQVAEAVAAREEAAGEEAAEEGAVAGARSRSPGPRTSAAP
jgi:hypothetical protein